MKTLPVLPRIVNVKLIGFRPLFTDTINFDIKYNTFIILGGNGLGKTTILQAIIYCLASEVDTFIDSDKSNRWGRTYFQGRLDNPDNALIMVDFFIEQTKITVMRGFKNRNILRLTIDNVEYDNPKDTDNQLEEFLVNYAGYENINDFRFLIHKLCYLPENRASLIWNVDAQTRLLMLFFRDLINEESFRERRATLKQLDSKRRHVNVDINNVKSKLKIKDDSDKKEVKAWGKDKDIIVDETNYDQVAARLQVRIKERIQLKDEIKLLKDSLVGINHTIGLLQEEMAQREENFILQQLQNIEDEETKLAIHKLLHLKHCPACGSHAAELSAKAEENLQKGLCPLCGAQQVFQQSRELITIDTELSSKLKERMIAEKELIALEKKVENIVEEENALQLKYDSYRLSIPTLSFLNENSKSSIQHQQASLTSLLREYNDLSFRFSQLQEELNREYERFSKRIKNRMSKLVALYEEYASAFMGISCTLEQAESNDKFLRLNLLVPYFSGKRRSNPNDCSEAQRFFLDIAFRMSLINLHQELTGDAGSFLCETPENALDMTYLDNVATMFATFTDRGHTLITTSNIQPGALAKPMLGKYTKSRRKACLLNLLDYGNLSNVQQKNLAELTKQVKLIVEG